MHYDPIPVTDPGLVPGDRVRLEGPRHTQWWLVRATSRDFAVCVRQTPFKPKGTLEYTVLDWRNGVRGPCNLIGWGFGDGSYSAEDCADMVYQFQTGELEVTHRNWRRIELYQRLSGGQNG